MRRTGVGVVWSVLVVLSAPDGLRAQVGEVDGAVVEARERAARGLRLFDEGRFDAALAEFQAAYDAAPNFRVLYNLGRVYEETGDAVRASETYTRYLGEGGDEIPTGRRVEVQARLVEQEGRIARVWIRANVAGATVHLDGAVVSRLDGSPLRLPLESPLLVSAGRRQVGLTAPGYAAAERTIELAGGVEETLVFELESADRREAMLRIHSPLPEVDVFVDGRHLGRTPFRTSVPVRAGRLALEARRAGYVTHQEEIEAVDGSEVDVNLNLNLDVHASPDVLGAVRFDLPDASHTLMIDGRRVRRPPRELPIGRHRVRIEVVERLPHEEVIDVREGSLLEYSPALEWTPEAEQSRRGSRTAQNTWGWVFALSGGALFFGLGPVFVHAQSRMADLNAQGEELARLINGCGTNSEFDPQCGGPAAMDERERELTEDIEPSRDTWNVVRALSAVGASAGAVLMVTGVVLLVLGEEDSAPVASGERAHLQFVAGWNRLAVRGVF